MTSSVEIGVNSRNEASAWHGVNDGGGALLVVERTLAIMLFLIQRPCVVNEGAESADNKLNSMDSVLVDIENVVIM